MKCIFCGCELQENESECPNCGKSQREVVPVIPDIRVEIPKKAKKQSSIIKDKPISSPSVPSAKNEKGKQTGNKKRILAAAGCVLAIAVGAVIFTTILSGSDKPELKQSKTVISEPTTERPETKEEQIAHANTDAKDLFIAATMVSDEVLEKGSIISAGVLTSDDALLGISTANKSDPDYSPVVLRRRINEINDEFESRIWFVAYDDGYPVAAYISRSYDNKIIGSYPNEAEGECMISFSQASGLTEVSRGYSGKSANDLFG
ncbi:MAG: hypothetical protein IJ740_15740 [Ruminococcus sp.]|nr:hypothetical protein [Ruminococcus sp.]